MSEQAFAAHVYVAITAVTAAMAKAGISKGRSNVQQGYKFRGIDEVYNALSSVLAENKLCILPRVLDRSVTERATKSGGVSTYVVLTVEFDLVSSIDGSRHVIRTMGEAMDSADKATNKAMSAAMKYACLMAFQVPTEGDNDADASHPEPAARRLSASQMASPSNDVAVAGYVAKIDAAADLKELMGIYTALRSDDRVAVAAKDYVVTLCSEKRRKLEGKAA